jgi:VWFA-related protein
MRLMMVVSALLVVIAAVAEAQVKESITVHYVEIPVTVLDRGGNPIRGLTAQNFEILDEGKPRAVSSLDMVDFGSADSLKAISPLNPVARRNFLIVFDLSFSTPFKIEKAQAAARKFVTTMVHPRDRVGVATIDVAHGLHLLSAFTTDRRLLEAAIANPRSFRGFDPLQVAGEAPLAALSDLSVAPGSEDQGTLDFKEILMNSGRLEDQYNRQKIDQQVSLLTGLSTTLRAVSGQKHIVFLSEGFDPRLIQGRDAHVSSEQVSDAVSVEAGQIWKVDNDNRYGSSSSLSVLASLTEAARRSDVILDAVDINGVRNDVSARQTGSGTNSNEGLHLLADATGGTVIKNSNDLSSDFARELKMQDVVYVLGFQAPTSKPGAFHPLKIRLQNVPGGHISYRAGYYEAGSATNVERSLSNAEVVLNDIPQDAIHIAALAAPFPTSNGDAQVPVILEINGSDLLAAAHGNTATTDVFIYAFDAEGLVRDSLYQRLQLDLSKLGEKLRNGGVKYYATLSLPAGTYAIKSLVQVHESGSNGFSRNDIVVPRSADVAVSQPFFFEDAARWLMIKGASHDKTNAGYPFHVNGDSFIPPVSVHRQTGEARKFVVFVRNASPEELSIETAPKARLLSAIKSAEGSKLVMELAGDAAKATALNVTIRVRGAAEQKTASVPLLN